MVHKKDKFGKPIEHGEGVSPALAETRRNEAEEKRKKEELEARKNQPRQLRETEAGARFFAEQEATKQRLQQRPVPVSSLSAREQAAIGERPITSEILARALDPSLEPTSRETLGPEKEELRRIAEERGVFDPVTQEPIISPEQENLGVILRIAESVFPKKIAKGFTANLPGGFKIEDITTETIPPAIITTIEDDLIRQVQVETGVQIDKRIEDADGTLITIGLIPAQRLPPRTEQAGVLAVVGAGVVGGAVAGPVSEFVGTDGQIRSLELALSQYNEMITIPARGVISGNLDPGTAFDKLDRMEESIFLLEEQLKISGLTSTKVSLALRGRGVEGRLLKLKEKLQEGRRQIFLIQTQEAFGERNIPKSVSFLRELQNE